jgi:hypothetical protein
VQRWFNTLVLWWIKKNKNKNCSTNSVIACKQNISLNKTHTHTHTHKRYVEKFDISENNIIKCQSCKHWKNQSHLCPIYKTTSWHIHKSFKQKNSTMQRLIENGNLKAMQECQNSLNEGANIPSCVFPLLWGCLTIAHNTNMIFPVAPFVLLATPPKHRFIFCMLLTNKFQNPRSWNLSTSSTLGHNF